MVMTKTRGELRQSLDVQNQDAAMGFALMMLDALYDAAKQAGITTFAGENIDKWRDETQFAGLVLKKPTYILSEIASTAKNDAFVDGFLKAMKAARAQS